ncbi:MAG: thioredoxin-dependent thiol peroxidase [Ignavibacteriales bacterium]|nr:MAG: thioredoxin-dependent thiol peroxidase [Ignavibacteriales bacterium]
MLHEGKKAPDFKLKDQDDRIISLSDFKGKNVVLYFYPKDDTPTCTTQACKLRDEFSAFKKIDAVVLGVSADSVSSHKKFRAKYKLPFTLLSDEEKSVIKKYDVWKEKSMFGKKYMGIVRTTFVIDKKGFIKKIFSNVRVPKHNKEVLDTINS